MSHISRIASPMSLCEEDLFDVDKKVETKMKLLQKLQNESPAAFLVGTIEKVNQRISDLDEELSKYDSQLVIESRSPPPEKYTDRYSRSCSPAVSLRHTAHSTRVSSDDVPNLRSKKATGSVHVKSDAPRLVELQQFPGWTKKQCVPLPHSLETTNVLDHVVNAQVDLERKPAYRQEFKRLIYSKMQQSILQDSFWWFFLEKFHPDAVNQGKLFQRISKNFVTLLLQADVPKFRDVFFLRYGSVLAQSMYSAFCLAFPQSWRQFDEGSFKEMLAQVCGEWISGIPPPPHTYKKWNIPALEPEGMRKEEVIKKKKKSDHTGKHLLSGGHISPFSSTASTKTSTVRSTSGSHKTHIRSITAKSDGTSSAHSPKPTPRVAELISEQTLLTPITEEPGTSTTLSTAGLKAKFVKSNQRSSCVAGRSMEFSRNVFNVYGRSPLLARFALQYGFARKSFCDVLVRHTLLHPSMAEDSQTYQDIIAESRRTASTACKSFRLLHEENIKSCNSFSAKQRAEYRSFSEKTNKLLSKPRQVHYLSNMILMEMKSDQDDTNPVGAASALQTALGAESAST